MLKFLESFKTFELVSSRKELNSNVDTNSKLIEPALMELKDYMVVLDANKSHPESAYHFTLEDSKRTKLDKESYRLLNRKKHGSAYIDYYVYNGKEHNQYVKTDDEGNPMRDDDGNILYLNDSEISNKNLSKYDKNVIATHNDIIVGSAQDEWGCVLIYTVEEFKGIGIGQELVKYYRGFYPNKTSGGTTSMGYKNLMKYYKSQVKLYLRNGIYSDMVKKGEISKEKVKRIVNSVKGFNYKKYKDTMYSKYLNINSYNRSFVYSDADIMLINDRILEYYDEYKGEGEDFYERFVFGHSHIIEYDNEQRIYSIDGKRNKDITDVIDYSLCYIKKSYGEDYATYFVTENTPDNVKEYFKNIDNSKFKVEWYEKNKCRIYNRECSRKINELRTGTKWFYNIEDKYGEIKDRIAENVYATFQ